jgi:hypothetical protein
METKNLAKVNEVAIQLVTDNGQKLVPIKPICEALGIDEDAQRRKLKDDELLSSTTVLSTAVGADGKDREMVCIPLKYVFGWLFTINPKNVKEEAREAVTKYRAKCYDVLYDYFSEQSEYLEAKNNLIEEKIVAYDSIREDFKNAERRLKEAKTELYKAKDFTYEDWKEMKNQTVIQFD